MAIILALAALAVSAYTNLRTGKLIMATKAEVQAKIEAYGVRAQKVLGEVSTAAGTALAEIASLKELVANADNVDFDFTTLDDALGKLDDLNPDALGPAPVLDEVNPNPPEGVEGTTNF